MATCESMFAARQAARHRQLQRPAEAAHSPAIGSRVRSEFAATLHRSQTSCTATHRHLQHHSLTKIGPKIGPNQHVGACCSCCLILFSPKAVSQPTWLSSSWASWSNHSVANMACGQHVGLRLQQLPHPSFPQRTWLSSSCASWSNLGASLL